MNRINTLRDLFRHFDWIGRRVIEPSSRLAEGQLDRTFELGFGTLRKTLWHIFVAKDLWLQRVGGEANPSRFEPADDAGLVELNDRLAQACARRDALLNSMSEYDCERDVRFRDMKGIPWTNRLGDILLHLYNHSVHHFAQALNMLRHVGAMPDKPIRLDYLFMYYENADWPAPALSAEVLRDYFDYGDWARDRVMDVAGQLGGVELDRPFEMGPGSIRKNMIHTHDAEAWWLDNWTAAARSPFPKTDERIALQDLREAWRQTAKARDDFLASTRDEDLVKPVEARPAPDRTIRFPLGVSMMQLCFHGTHHRAQTINMLRRCGHPVPSTDYIVWRRELRR